MFIGNACVGLKHMEAAKVSNRCRSCSRLRDAQATARAAALASPFPGSRHPVPW
jgi:hypothetical protein